MTEAVDDMSQALHDALAKSLPGLTGLVNLRRLSGGASLETSSFDAQTEKGDLPLILRRARGGSAEGGPGAGKVSLETEAKLLQLAAKAGVPVPTVRHVLTEEEGLGPGFVMDRIEGETIARKILRDEEYAEARPRLAYQCGEILARIHSIPRGDLPELSESPGAVQREQYFALYDAYDYPHPVFEVALRWLADNMIEPPRLALVHGDFRNGNLIIDTEGVAAVLDWELAHVGDPLEDLGWICTNSWRFGLSDFPVGGFGHYDDLFAGYEAGGGGSVDPDRVKFWEVFGSLKWGIICMTMYNIYKSGMDRSVERAAIGRRSSEAEIDLLNLLAGRV